MIFSSLLSIRSHPMRVRGLKLTHYTIDPDKARSHPMRVRGLKHYETYIVNLHSSVAPHAGAWIETHQTAISYFRWLSHPMRVRGLKPIERVCAPQDKVSHPMRVRGLKHCYIPREYYYRRRTPCGCVD